ncbi:MAG: VTT domain-containing protein [bacterium]|nr:VTT domain-containing protein [bacterium]
MHTILNTLHGLSDIIITFGYIGIFITIFAESGFLLGFFLPGDSLLFTLGILAAKGIFNIYYLIGLCIVAAIMGDSFGYYIGNKFGPRLFNREESFFFKKEYVERTQAFFLKHGKRTIIMARFVPIVRTFAPILAGVGKMDYKTFLSYNIIGGVVWAGGVLSIAYVLGTKIPGIEDYLGYIIVGIILVSVIPVVIDLLRKH